MFNLLITAILIAIFLRIINAIDPPLIFAVLFVIIYLILG